MPTEEEDALLHSVWEAAKLHGEESEADHEVGDLQDFSRILWDILTPRQRTIAFRTYRHEVAGDSDAMPECTGSEGASGDLASIQSREGKTNFLRGFTDAVTAHLEGKLDKVPESWDGHELREWVADQFDWERTMVPRPIPGRPLDKSGSRRRARYRKEKGKLGL